VWTSDHGKIFEKGGAGGLLWRCRSLEGEEKEGRGGGGPAVWRDLWRRRGGLAEAGGMGRGANRERDNYRVGPSAV
jgi:hypothetical protein